MDCKRSTFDCLTRVLDSLACPQCFTGLARQEQFLLCDSCGVSYPITNEITDLRPPEYREKAELMVWSKHWSENHQRSFSQKFFSFYRKAVFARTVQYFLNRYFPSNGIMVETGSGTSETSMRINKCGGGRILVAVDIVMPVLSRCHPIMDMRIGGDVFHLPFLRNSVDGIWNVGVMEHFTHDQIDQIMREFHRVLKPGARIILLWPATDSVPQKLLRIVEVMVNLGRRFTGEQERFQFHPDEISKLKSMEEGREVLTGNGFYPVYIDYGFRSLMAFKTLVGEKI